MILVCPLSRLQDTVAGSGAQHLLSVINAGTPVTRPAGIAAEHHRFIGFNDIVAPQDGMIHPTDAHMAELLAFVRLWPRRAPLVVHCYAGISRSTAAAFIAACALNPRADEADIAARLRAASPTATPNARLVALGDAALGRQGRMSAAIEAIGRGRDAFEGTPFRLEVE
ncbi:MAG TPA: protein-tyrosine phosphatase family protein [Xanthobacteraceae bacterium]|nr:protein-tyrosine phosphatase family protein [Xanthobacteraceae bacterium]